MDPQLARVLTKMPVLRLDDLQKIRALNVATPMPVTASDRQVPVRWVTVPGSAGRPTVRVCLYGTSGGDRRRPAVLHAHPGLTFGTVAMDQARCLRFAADLDCLVASVDYRLAPEHPYPAAVDDCYAVLDWLATTADLGVDPERIAVAGCSTGATLAAAVALRARDLAGPKVCFQLLVQPSLDDRLDTASMEEFDQPGPCEAGRVGSAITWRHYLRQVQGDPPSDAAPTRAAHLRGVPATYLSTVEFDCLRDEGWAFAQRLLADGVPVEFHHYAGAFHAFDLVVRTAALSKAAIDEQSAALARAFARSVGGDT